jgi:radical SAM/Cys-rich protein
MSGRPRITSETFRSPMASSAAQLERLRAVILPGDLVGDDAFNLTLRRQGFESLRAGEIQVFQMNLGRRCNMSCLHCHVDAGPDRTETMTAETIAACLTALDQTGAGTVDLTGGAPEMNPGFRDLVLELRRRGKHVIVRSNLTLLLEPIYEDLPEWFAAAGVEVVASLPHFRPRNTDAQRGSGTFEKSITVLKRLNAAGYGKGDSERCLTLVANPTGAWLAGNQLSMQAEWQAALQRDHGVSFDRLLALNNMPCARFLDWLDKSNNLDDYMTKLVDSFNPEAVAGLMCHFTLSVSWDGRMYDCDFNQMLELEICKNNGQAPRIQDFSQVVLLNRLTRTARHCFGCTAGAGSSCGGATT